jgi:hypothetical protein
MPIRPEALALYPADWPEISRRIRFDRAKGQCECRGECGREHPAGRCLAVHGRPIDPTAEVVRFVVLTTMHLNHDERDGRDENLLAACQRCHLTYDAKRHAKNAATTRQKKLEAAGQERLPGLEG